MTAAWIEAWRTATRLELDAAVELRHRLHREPRLSGDEADTAQVVADALGADGKMVAGTGRLVDIAGAPGTRVVALRAELDGLPIGERSDVPWRSENAAMHACGHDLHLAALVAVARAARTVELPVRLVALLQPREEGTYSGARDVVAEGHAGEWAAVVAAHVQPQLPPGVVCVTPGAVNASTTEFTIEVTGRGGHSGYPHMTHDPVLALSAIVVALQQVAAQRVDPVAGCALMVTQLNAGSVANVVPVTATARGTLRSMSVDDDDEAKAAMREVVEHTARAHGCSVTLDLHRGEPTLVNDPALAIAAHDVLDGMGRQTDATWRSFGSDDFSHFGDATRTLMLMVGTGREGGGLHEPTYVPSDAYVGLVAGALIAGYAAAAASR